MVDGRRHGSQPQCSSSFRGGKECFILSRWGELDRGRGCRVQKPETLRWSEAEVSGGGALNGGGNLDEIATKTLKRTIHFLTSEKV